MELLAAIFNEIFGLPLTVAFILPAAVCVGPVLLYILVKTIQEFRKK